VPHTARWRCPGCGRDLGVIVGATLAVDMEQVAQVVATPKGTIVTCLNCRTERTWTLRRTA
jgi:hypothetical protein